MKGIQPVNRRFFMSSFVLIGAGFVIWLIGRFGGFDVATGLGLIIGVAGLILSAIVLATSARILK